MVISELALGLFTNLLYESFKNIPEYISNTSSKVYEKAIEEFSNKNYKLTGIQIDTFFRQKNVEKAIKKYLKNPHRLDCSNIEALGNIKSDTAVKPLINALKDENSICGRVRQRHLERFVLPKIESTWKIYWHLKINFQLTLHLKSSMKIEKEEKSKVFFVTLFTHSINSVSSCE